MLYEINHVADERTVPLETIMVLNGTLKNVDVRILKDDGCGTNVFYSCSFLRRHKRIFHEQRSAVTVSNKK